MRQIPLTIVALVTLLTPSVSWSNVDGKSLVCERVSNKKNYDFDRTVRASVQFYKFTGGFLYRQEFYLEYDKTLQLYNSIVGKYLVNHEYITAEYFSLNRQDLSLQGNWEGVYQCDVFISNREFDVELEKKRKWLMKWVNKELKKNKI